MARVEASETVARLALDREHDENYVVAESSLLGERAIAIVRLTMFLLFGLSMQVAGMLDPSAVMSPHPWRVWVIGFYLVFSLVTLVAVFALKEGNPNVSRYWPFVPNVIDFTVFFLLSYMRWESDHRFFPETTAATFGVLITFSVARFWRLHVFFATFLACTYFVTLHSLTVGLNQASQWFVLTSFMSLGFLVGWANGRLRKMFVELRRRENLSRFLPRQVADKVLRNKGMLKPTQREVTILFCDIRDFTAMSETLEPDALLAFLDRYFGHMSQIVKAHDGVVNKFLGDGMLAVWGVPDRDEQHPEKALRAALDMRKKLVEFNQERVNENLPPVRMGIGIHTGVVAAGMLGGADQHEYTVIGDAVNLASRIEGLTKTLGVDLLVSESTWTKLQGHFTGERAGDEKVKGRAQSVVVYTVSKAA